MKSIAPHIIQELGVSPGMTRIFSTYESPVGELTLVAGATGLRAVALQPSRC